MVDDNSIHISLTNYDGVFICYYYLRSETLFHSERSLKHTTDRYMCEFIEKNMKHGNYKVKNKTLNDVFERKYFGAASLLSVMLGSIVGHFIILPAS